MFEALRLNLSPSSNHFTFVLFERVVGRAWRWHRVAFSAGASLGWSGGAMVLGKLPVPVFLTTVELQWLEHLWDHENELETGVVRASEC